MRPIATQFEQKLIAREVRLASLIIIFAILVSPGSGIRCRKREYIIPKRLTFRLVYFNSHELFIQKYTHKKCVPAQPSGMRWFVCFGMLCHLVKFYILSSSAISRTELLSVLLHAPRTRISKTNILPFLFQFILCLAPSAKQQSNKTKSSMRISFNFLFYFFLLFSSFFFLCFRKSKMRSLAVHTHKISILVRFQMYEWTTLCAGCKGLCGAHSILSSSISHILFCVFIFADIFEILRSVSAATTATVAAVSNSCFQNVFVHTYQACHRATVRIHIKCDKLCLSATVSALLCLLLRVKYYCGKTSNVFLHARRTAHTHSHKRCAQPTYIHLVVRDSSTHAHHQMLSLHIIFSFALPLVC